MKKREAIISVASILIGVVCGFMLAVKLFAIEIDVLGIPYKNQSVVATKDIKAAQGDIEITIPRGSKIIHRYTAEEVPVYSIEVDGPVMGDQTLFTESKESGSFYINKDKNR